MTSTEAITMAEELMTLADKYDIAKRLVRLELEAESRGIDKLVANLTKELGAIV